VLIDIKIGSTPNGLNPNGHQAVSVAIFGSDSLPAGPVDISSVLLAGAASDRSALRDVNGDGRPDLVLQFRIAVSIAPQTGQLCLSGRTLQGAPLLGCDTIRLLGPR